MMTVGRDEINPYTAPRAELAPPDTTATAAGAELVPAAPWRRLVAFLIDYLLAYGLGLTAGGLLGAGLAVLTNPEAPGEGIDRVASSVEEIAAAVGLAVVILYFALLEGSAAGATLGKRLLRLRVVGIDGRPIGVGRAAWRTAVKLLLSIMPYLMGSAWACFNPQRRTLHDLGARTMVIRSDIQWD